MNAEDLQKFCHKFRPNMMQPWSSGEYTFATEGSVLIRVPRIEEVTFKNGPKNAEALFEAHGINNKSATYFTVPFPVYQKPGTVICQGCAGTGCSFCVECQECSGTGTCIANTPVCCGMATLNARLLELIKPLGVKEFKVAGEEDPVYFRFPGGDGLMKPTLRPT